MIKIQGQTAIVTGAGKGVGKELVTALLVEGLNVMAVSRSEEDLKQLNEETKVLQEEKEVRLLTKAGDVSTEVIAEEAVSEAKNKFGRIDILVNNAGVGRYGTLEELSIEDYDVMMNSNMRSTFLFTKAVLSIMKEQKYGHVVNVASVAGKKGLPKETVYCASKFAQVGFAQALDYEVREHGIKVSSICPGGINTHFAMGTGRSEGDGRLTDFLNAKDVVDAIMFIVKQEPKSRIIEIFMRPMVEDI
ncbi:SDR family oxidoreductase [Aneurinibacillus tyrosinisolvens]|uniref:SDR family oxidoreductase n=1 Tax=Aneurinibacillus tyrosinisolvens TaxID=1443435 RepID=UPI00069A96BA|nr:SDR family oxidoreductase [Aneurinibacillus tyrosinisolvens]